MASILFGFPMVLTIGKQNKIVAISFLDHWRTELKNIRYSNMFDIQAPTVVMIR